MKVFELMNYLSGIPAGADVILSKSAWNGRDDAVAHDEEDLTEGNFSLDTDEKKLCIDVVIDLPEEKKGK